MMMKTAIAITTITTTTTTAATYIAIAVHTTTTSFTYAPFVWARGCIRLNSDFFLATTSLTALALCQFSQKSSYAGVPRSILGADIEKSFLDCGCGGG